MAYSVDRLRKAREEKGTPTGLAAIPPDAPHDTDDAIGFWNGERFVSWREWIISRPVSQISDQKLVETNEQPQPLVVRTPRRPRRASHQSNSDIKIQIPIDICTQVDRG
jgi:hypothetical protein